MSVSHADKEMLMPIRTDDKREFAARSLRDLRRYGEARSLRSLRQCKFFRHIFRDIAARSSARMP